MEFKRRQLIAFMVLISSCSTVSDTNQKARTPLMEARLKLKESSVSDVAIGGATSQQMFGSGQINPNADPTEYRTIPGFGQVIETVAASDYEMPEFRGGEISVLIPPQPLPDFIDTVFGELLELGYILDPAVSDRSEIVTYRSAPNITREKLFASAIATLEGFGVAIQYQDGEVNAILREDLLRQSPKFIRSRARGSVPSNLRPVAKYIEVQSMRVNSIVSVVREVFPTQNDLSIKALDPFNAMIITGLPDDIARAEEIIAQMDTIRFANERIATVAVRNWDLTELTKTVEEQLSIEGFSITSNRQLMRSINLYPIAYTSQLVIFARDEELLNYAVDTVRRLDESAQVNNELRAFVYKGRYYEAEVLAQILNGGGRATPLSIQPNGAQGDVTGRQLNTTNQASSGSGLSGGAFDVQFTVDKLGNRLIYMATEEQNLVIRELLRRLDTPQDEVLIDVTIAEVTLTDDTSYGLDFLMSQIGSQGYSVGLGTAGGIGLTTGGLNGAYSSGDYTVNFSALSSNNQINILSSPRLVVKSGSVGSIGLGTDVPIITSQAAASTQIGGTTDVLQSVEYRKTGILLDIQPLVLSDDRIDIQVSQEVSSAEENANQAIASPIISNRQISTELTLQDGQSAILGGLIENRYTRGTTGVPLAKDIPIIGNLFKTETLNSTRTMLLVMITPYILTTREDRNSTVGSLAQAMNDAFQNQVDESLTLTKPNEPFQIDLD